jgi:hypothetical protein
MRANGIPGTVLLPSKKLPVSFSNTEGMGNGGNNWAEFTSKTYYVSMVEGAHSKTLLLTKLGFAVPVGAKIEGIEVKATLRRTGSYEGSVYVKPGLEGSSTKELSSVLVSGVTSINAAWGGPTTTWSGLPTVSKINESTFGIGFLATENPVGGGQIEIINPEVIVYYAISAVAVQQDAVIFASRESQIRYDGSYREDKESTAMVRIAEETGDLFRIPPSGIEKSPVELLLKGSHGDFREEPDDQIDKMKAQVFYRPCYIGRI